MRYLFIKRYNPAYEHFIIKYLNEDGIEFDDKLTFNDVEPRELFADKMPSPSPQEKLFCDYVRSWRYHPEGRPSVDFFFYKAIGDEIPSIRELQGLESELPVGQKLIFTRDDIALEIARFYKRYMHDALKRDMDQGAIGWNLLKYFSAKESGGLPDSRFVGEEREDEEIHRKAGEFLEWLEEITPEEVARHVDRVLHEHAKDKDHMKLHPLSPDPQSTLQCDHGTDLIKLSGYRHGDVNDESLYLRPSRGFRVWEKRKWEDDWFDIIFPQYHVKLES